MPVSDPLFNLIFFLRPLENHEDWPLPSPLSFLLITKKVYFEVSFLFCLVFYFLYFIFSRINSFYFKIKYFSQKIILKIYLKKLIRVLRIKISFYLFIYLKIICNHILFGSHPSRFSTKILVLNKNTNQSLWSQINGIILG